ncbi:MAG: hypothetical protein WC681_24800 [Sterolibacterium sp.]
MSNHPLGSHLHSAKPGSFFWLMAFGVSMGYFEAAVVVDLRQIFCPGGNLFPIQIELNQLGIVELGREFFSLVMLASVAVLAGRNRLQRLGHFLALFAVWDVFYYVFLKLLIGWPESLMTWDLLFMLPVPWIGPVLAPVIVSATIFVLGRLLVRIGGRGIELHRGAWWLSGGCAAGLVLVVSFCWDCQHIMKGGLPRSFPWGIFAIGELMFIAVIAGFAWTHRSLKMDTGGNGI